MRLLHILITVGYILSVAILLRHDRGTDMARTLDEMVARYTSAYGTPSADAVRKLKAMLHLQPTCTCAYCERPLFGGSDTWFDHMDGNGGYWRNDLKITSRDEYIMMLNADKHHPEENRRQFLCATCNSVKSSTLHDVFIKTDAYKMLTGK